MSKSPLNDESDLVPSTPDEEDFSEDGSRYEVYETPAAHSFNEYSKSNAKASAFSHTEKIEESVQEEDSDSYSVEGEEDEESQHSSRPGSSDAEEPEDEVDKSRNSNLGLSPSGTKKELKQKQAQRFIESSEDDSAGDESDEDVSYHVRGKRLGSSEKDSTSLTGDPDESYQVIQAGRRQAKFVIRSSGENSAEPSDTEGLAIQKANAFDSSDESSLSPEDSFGSSVKKKPTRNPIDSDSDSSGPPVRVKTFDTDTSDESDSSAEATPRFHREQTRRKAVSSTESEDDTEEEVRVKATPRNRDQFIDSDVSTEEEVVAIAPRLPSSSRIPTPQAIQRALLATSLDRHDSGNDSNMDPLNGTHEMSRKSADKRFLPAEPFGEEEVPIQDLSNSILEVSSTVVSFSSPEVEGNEQDQSITELASPEITRTLPVVRLSAAEMTRMREDLESQKLLLKSSNLKSLPDGGERLREKIRTLTEQLETANKPGVNTPMRPVPVSSAASSEVQEDELRNQLQVKKWAMGNAKRNSRSACELKSVNGASSY